MKRLLVSVSLSMLISAGASQAGYVQSFVDANGGCEADAGVLMMLEEHLSPRGEREFLGKLSSEWTDEDFEEYRRIYTACARRWSPNPAHMANVNHSIEERIKEVNRVILGKARQERQAALASEQAKQDMERAESAAKRERMMEQARRDRERATATAKLAEEEAPMIAEAERQLAEAAKARQEAEERLNAVRNRVQVQQQQRITMENQKMAALTEQQQIERTETDRAEEAELQGRTCRVTLKQFEGVRYGMPLRQVQRAFGCLGRLTTGTRVAGVGTYSTYVFQGSDDTSAVSTVFRGQSLESKSQIGLE